jgi:pyruvate/2-oxoglutarate dehydrogenase complex dihydrolipoamide dehydrogenase (E3) component
VIGTGQAGVPLAVRLAGAGKRVLIAERALPGGTCINYGCTPTKTMVASARAAHVARGAARLGVNVADVRVDLAAVVARKDRMVEAWRDGVRRRVQNAGDRLTFVAGNARFVGPREIVVNGERQRAPVIVLNVGARPALPQIPGLDSIDWVDSTRIMELRQLPEHLVVLGGGYIGCEFGQMFRRFGSAVTIVNRGPRLLDREDEDVIAPLEEVFRNEGINLCLDAAVTAVARTDHGVAVTLGNGARVEGSHLLVAVGRSPNTEDLGCDVAGITLDKRGFISVDEQYLTSAEGVYAVGDVLGGPQFTHTSWDDHRILFDILQGNTARGRTGRLIPYCVFTDPQVARVGLSQREANEKRIPYEVATMPFSRIARAIELDEPAGILKVLLDPASERILGAAIVGVEAGELIQIFSVLMQAGGTARAIVDVQAIHPTLAEGVQSVVMNLSRYRL